MLCDSSLSCNISRAGISCIQDTESRSLWGKLSAERLKWLCKTAQLYLVGYIRASTIIDWFATDICSNGKGMEKLDGVSWLKQLRIHKLWGLTNVSSRMEDVPKAY